LTPNFSVDVARTEASAIVTVSGELDMRTAPWLAEELHRAQRCGLPVILDLERVEFMDCSSLRVLVNASEASKPGLCVTPGSEQVRKLLALTGVDSVLEFVPAPLDLVRDAA
jgi:anti-sigma B factor antagonist